MSSKDNKEEIKQQFQETKLTIIIGRIASVLSILMYVSYIAQISNNLQGSKGSPIQPLCAAVNSTFWVIYGLLKRHRDWPIVIANIPGVILAFVTFITSL